MTHASPRLPRLLKYRENDAAAPGPASKNVTPRKDGLLQSP